MANYSPSDVLTMVTPFVKGVPLATVQYMAFDMAHSDIWKSAMWQWTQGSLTAIALVDGTQDYTCANSDFYRLVNARITRTDLSPNQFQELTVVRYLPKDLRSMISWGNFKLISWDKSTQKLRLESAAQVTGSVTMQIDGAYQKTPTKITASNWATALVAPDYYIETMVEGFLYYLYKFTDDSRAGVVSTDGRGRQSFSGQLAKFYHSLSDMANAEDLADGNDFLYPTESLGASSYQNVSGTFGP